MTPTDTTPRLRVCYQDATGKDLIKPVEIRIPAELSMRVAKMHLLEMLVKTTKASLGDALKSMGFK